MELHSAEKLCLQAAQKISEARRAKFDELRRTLQYVEASRASATKHMSLFSSLLARDALQRSRIIQRRLRFSGRRQLSAGSEVMRAGNQQFLRWESSDDFAAVFGHYHFFFETRSRPAIACRPVGFQS